MRITGLHIDGFGVFHNRAIDDLDQPLVLILGENEAGKSTLLGFIRTILFGFPRANARGELFYPPTAGGGHGGRIDFILKSAERFILSRTPGPRGGRVTVEGPAGEIGGAERLIPLLGGVTYEVFRNIYAFGLSELQSFETLQGDGITAAIYGAGFGTGLQALPQAKKRIQTRMDALFKRGGSKPTVNLDIAALERVQQALSEVGRQVHRFDEAVAEKERVDAQIATITAAVENHRLAEQRFDAYGRLWPEWISLLENAAALDALSPCGSPFPEDGLDRLKRLRERIVQHEIDLTDLSEQRDRLSAAAAGCEIDAVLLARADIVLALVQEKTAYLEKTDRRPALVHEKTALEKNIQVLLEKLGLGETALSQIDRSLFAREEIRSYQARTTGLTQTLVGVEEILAERKERFQKLSRELQAAEMTVQALEPLPPEPDPGGVLKLKQGRDRFADTLLKTQTLKIRQAQAMEDFRRILQEIDPGWQASDLDRFDASVSGRRRLEELSQQLEASQRALLTAEITRSEREHRLSSERVKWQLALEEHRPPEPSTRQWLMIAVGLLVTGLSMGWLWTDPVSPWPLVALIGSLVYFLFLLNWLNTLRRDRFRAKKRMEALGLDLAIHEQATQTAASAEAAARNGLTAAAVAWQAQLKTLGVAETLSPTVAMALFFKVETAREMRRSLGDINAEFLQLAAIEDAYEKTAAGLPGITIDPAIGGPSLLQAVDLFIAHLPDHERQRETTRQARETARRKTEENELARQELLAAVARKKALIQEKETAQNGWREWLKTVGLPTRLSADTAIEALDVIDAAITAIGRRERLADETARIDGALLAYRSGVEKLAAELKQPLPDCPEPWPLVLDSLTERLSVNRENRREKAAFTGQASALDRRISALREKWANDQERLVGLLAEAGTDTEPDFLRKGHAHAERHRLMAAISENEKNLRRISGERNLAVIKAGLSGLSLTDITTAKRAEAEAGREAAHRLEDFRNRRAEIIREIAALSSDAETTRLRGEETRLRAELARHVFDWSRYALAAHLLDRARERFEKTHQPHVIRDASEFFDRFTGGRYPQLRAPLGEKSFQAIRSDNRTIAPALLSRGTAEQLYLSVRFGLIRHRAKSEEPLPVVMDDILVNFDPKRAAATAEAIMELTRTHQVLFFTCHPETVHLFQTIGGNVGLLHL